MNWRINSRKSTKKLEKENAEADKAKDEAKANMVPSTTPDSKTPSVDE